MVGRNPQTNQPAASSGFARQSSFFVRWELSWPRTSLCLRRLSAASLKAGPGASPILLSPLNDEAQRPVTTRGVRNHRWSSGLTRTAPRGWNGFRSAPAPRVSTTTRATARGRAPIRGRRGGYRRMLAEWTSTFVVPSHPSSLGRRSSSGRTGRTRGSLPAVMKAPSLPSVSSAVILASVSGMTGRRVCPCDLRLGRVAADATSQAP